MSEHEHIEDEGLCAEEHGHHHHHHDEAGNCHEHEHEHHHHHHDEKCGCHEHEHGHHHHHHDEASNCHEHGNEHHHHPDHDGECDCGCDEHGHEHHHHDEGHRYEIAGYSVFETHSHEGATICSFEKDILTDPERAKVAMEDAIHELSGWLESTGALIGHVKGYMKEAGPTTTFSTTGGTLNIESHEAQGAAIGFASIVFGPSEDALKDKVIEVFERL